MDKTVPPGAAILLDFIRATEVGRSDRASYDVIYGHNQDKLPKPLTAMSYGDIVDAQRGWSKRFKSSAAGGYQFMRATLQDLARANPMEIDAGLLFTPDLQHRLAYKLLVRRGYPKFVTGQSSLVEFAEQLAKEWASLPVLAGTKGAKRQIRRGQSYYAGDGLNRALVKPEKVEAVLKRVFEAAARARENEKAVAAPKPERLQRPVSRSGRFWTWLLTAGGSIVTALKELNVVALDWRVQVAILLVVVGFAVYAITSMPAVRSALGQK